MPQTNLYIYKSPLSIRATMTRYSIIAGGAREDRHHGSVSCQTFASDRLARAVYEEKRSSRRRSPLDSARAMDCSKQHRTPRLRSMVNHGRGGRFGPTALWRTWSGHGSVANGNFADAVHPLPEMYRLVDGLNNRDAPTSIDLANEDRHELLS